VTFTVNVDVVQEAEAGFYYLPVIITGVNDNTKTSISAASDLVLPVRVNPEPPQLIVTDIEYPGKLVDDKTKISGGKEFNLVINVLNDGDDTARDVFVNLLETQRDSDVSLQTDFTPDVAKAEGALEPFSTEVSKIFIGDIAPGETKTVTYTIKVDKNVVKGRNYEMWVYVDYSDDLNRGWSYNTEISIHVKGAQPVEETDYETMTNPASAFGVGIFLIIIIFILALVWVKFVMRPKKRYGGPADFPEPVVEEPAAREGPLPPPPGKETKEGSPETFKVCPACHKSVPASHVTCPHCGCAL
jgi:hypothetical protein